MRSLRYFVALLAAGTLSGCAAGLMGSLPVVHDPANASEIYVLRGYQYVGSGISAYVSFDDNDVCAIRVAQYTRFNAPSGNHTISVRNPGFSRNAIPISLEPKKTYYFAVTMGFSNFYIAPISEADAKPYLEADQYMPLDNAAQTGKPGDAAKTKAPN